MAYQQLLAPLTIVVFCLCSFANTFEDDKLTAHLNSLKHRAEYKKFAYYVSEMTLEKRRFEKNSGAYVEYGPRGDFAPPHVRKLTKSEVLNNKSEMLKRELDGFKLSDNKVFESLKAVAPGGFDTFLGFVDVATQQNARTPSISEIDQNTISEVLNTTDPELKKYIDTQFEQQFGVPLENIKELPEVRWDLNLDSIIKRQTEIDAQLDGIEETEKKQNELLEHSLAETKKLLKEAIEIIGANNKSVVDEQEYQTRRSNILGGISGIGSVLRMSGHEREAKAVDTAGKIAGIFMDLDNANTWANLAAFGGYAAALELTLGLFETGPSFEESLMESIQDLFDAIEDVRVQMHARFDRIDSQLSRILLKIDWNQKLDSERFRALKSDLNSIKQNQSLIIRKIDQHALNTLDQQISVHASRCGIMNNQISYQKINFSSESLFQTDCLNYIVHSATTSSLFDNIDLTPLPLKDMFFYSTDGSDFLDYLPTLIHGIETAQTSLILDDATKTSPTLSQMPHYKLWLDSANQYISLFDNYPEYRNLFLQHYFSEVHEAGKRLISTVRGLVLKEKQIRQPELFKFLDNYNTTIANTIDFISEKLQVIAEKKPFGFNLNTMNRPWGDPADLNPELRPLDHRTPISIDRLPQYKELGDTPSEVSVPFCEGHKVSKLPRMNYKYYNAPTIKLSPKLFGGFRVPNFSFPKEFNNTLPPELKWIHYFDREKFSFCIEDIGITDYNEFIVNRKKKSYSDVSYSTKVKIRISFDGIVLSVGQFNSHVSFSTRNVTPRPSKTFDRSFDPKGYATAFDNLSNVFLEQIFNGLPADKNIKARKPCSFNYICGVRNFKLETQSIFASAPNRNVAFYKGMNWGYLEQILSKIRTTHEKTLEDDTFIELTTTYSENHTTMISYRNLLLGLIQMGLNDALIEKNALIDHSLQLPSYNDLIIEMIQHQTPPEILKSQVQVIIGRLKETFVKINSSETDPRPPMDEYEFILNQLRLRAENVQ